MNEIQRLRQIHKILRAVFPAILFFFFLSPAIAQDLPKEIRGYKVYRADISVTNQTESGGAAADKSEAYVKVGEPKLTEISLAGITFELSAEIETARQSGTITFLTFQDFRVNNLEVEVKEYKESFDFKKNQLAVLPKPIEITVGVGQTLRGALGELKDSQEEWTVTGKVFVFGQFKKSFLKFKRVIPVTINLRIKKPLK